MYKKVLFATMLFAFVGFQLALSLECCSCKNPVACLQPKIETCTNATVNATISELQKYFIEVPNVANSNVNCLYMKYTNKTDYKTGISVSGCAYRTMNVCNLSLESAFKSAKKTKGYTCHGNKCNAWLGPKHSPNGQQKVE